jgi:hypothetical protein
MKNFKTTILHPWTYVITIIPEMVIVNEENYKDCHLPAYELSLSKRSICNHLGISILKCIPARFCTWKFKFSKETWPWYKKSNMVHNKFLLVIHLEIKQLSQCMVGKAWEKKTIFYFILFYKYLHYICISQCMVWQIREEERK